MRQGKQTQNGVPVIRMSDIKARSRAPQPPPRTPEVKVELPPSPDTEIRDLEQDELVHDDFVSDPLLQTFQDIRAPKAKTGGTKRRSASTEPGARALAVKPSPPNRSDMTPVESMLNWLYWEMIELEGWRGMFPTDPIVQRIDNVFILASGILNQLYPSETLDVVEVIINQARLEPEHTFHFLSCQRINQMIDEFGLLYTTYPDEQNEDGDLVSVWRQKSGKSMWDIYR